MLEVVPLTPKKLEDYRIFIGDEEIAAIQALAEPLKRRALLAYQTRPRLAGGLRRSYTPWCH